MANMHNAEPDCKHSTPEQTNLTFLVHWIPSCSASWATEKPPVEMESVLWCFLVLFWMHTRLARLRVALMALIDCLAVINGHMLSMHIVDILTQISRSLEKHLFLTVSSAFGTGQARGARLWSAGPRADLRFAVRLKIFKEMASPHWASDNGSKKN